MGGSWPSRRQRTRTWSAPCPSLQLRPRWATLSRFGPIRILHSNPPAHPLAAEPCPQKLCSALSSDSQSGLPYIEVLCKNRYVGRTFIQPNTRLRQLGVAKKFGALTDNFAGKRVVLIDDSIVRGNTISPIIKLLKEAGATEVCQLTL